MHDPVSDRVQFSISDVVFDPVEQAIGRYANVARSP